MDQSQQVVARERLQCQGVSKKKSATLSPGLRILEVACRDKVNFLNQAIKVNVEEKDVQAGRPIVFELLHEHASQSGSGFQITTSAEK